MTEPGPVALLLLGVCTVLETLEPVVKFEGHCGGGELLEFVTFGFVREFNAAAAAAVRLRFRIVSMP